MCSTAPLHLSTTASLHYITASLLCTTACTTATASFHYITALHHGTTPLHYCHCTTATAASLHYMHCHCITVLHHSTVLHCTTATGSLHYITASLLCIAICTTATASLQCTALHQCTSPLHDLIHSITHCAPLHVLHCITPPLHHCMYCSTASRLYTTPLHALIHCATSLYHHASTPLHYML